MQDAGQGAAGKMNLILKWIQGRIKRSTWGAADRERAACYERRTDVICLSSLLILCIRPAMMAVEHGFHVVLIDDIYIYRMRQQITDKVKKLKIVY